MAWCFNTNPFAPIHCKGWTHYSCTKLPAYQLFILSRTSRKYTCELCTEVPLDLKNKWKNNSAVPIKITDAHVPSDIDSKTIEIITRFEQSLVDTLTSVHKSGKDELSHQLKTDLEQKNELDLKVTKLESSIVNSVTTMHNQEKEEMINKLKADLEQQQLSCLKTSELDTNLQALSNHLEKLVTMNTELSEKLQTKLLKILS